MLYGVGGVVRLRLTVESLRRLSGTDVLELVKNQADYRGFCMYESSAVFEKLYVHSVSVKSDVF